MKVKLRARILAVAAGAAVLLVSGIGAANAHVTVETGNAAAGSTALLTFSVSHGCDGSPTTRVAVKIPAGINSAAPTINPGWSVSKKMQRLANPVTDSHGTSVTERVDQVIYTARSPLADGYRDTFTVAVPLPEDAEGRTLAFPTIQTCQRGETAWIDRAAEGQNADDLEAPAPAIVATAAVASGNHGDSGDGQSKSSDSGQGVAATAGDGAVSEAGVGQGSVQPALTLGIAALLAGLAGFAAGSVALLRGHRTTP
ncbi:MAG TPA: YcnI family protein [Propionibacteriaceae bacterium]|nr:YcnI family protein [Propionibacteriaceae bacterium]